MKVLTELAKKTNAYNEPPPVGHELWKNSTFETFYRMNSPKAKGTRGERLVADLFEGMGSNILRNKKGKPARMKGDSDHDIVVDNYLTEVKTSLTWGDQRDSFTWQQIRTKQKYDRIVFLGINPDNIKVWWAKKEDLDKYIAGNKQYRQHGGKNGEQDTYWIKNEIPSWFREIEDW